MKLVTILAILCASCLTADLPRANAQILPPVRGLYIRNDSHETIQVWVLFTFVDRDGFTYNAPSRQLKSGDDVCIDTGPITPTRTYYIAIKSTTGQWANLGGSFACASVHQVNVPILKKCFSGFYNRTVAERTSNADFRHLLSHYESFGNFPGNRIQSTGNYNKLRIVYNEGGKGTVYVE